MSELQDYERQCKIIREENQAILEAFELWLFKKGLSKATARKHRENIDFYINEFLLYEEPKRCAEGINDVGLFLGYWFIRKAMWASETTIKSNAASLKKFYDFLKEQGEVDIEAVKEMKKKIRYNMPEWIATVRRMNLR